MKYNILANYFNPLLYQANWGTDDVPVRRGLWFHTASGTLRLSNQFRSNAAREDELDLERFAEFYGRIYEDPGKWLKVGLCKSNSTILDTAKGSYWSDRGGWSRRKRLLEWRYTFCVNFTRDLGQDQRPHRIWATKSTSLIHWLI